MLKEVSLNLENYFISHFKSDYIGDDAAVVGEYIYSKDAFFEGVHFKKEWLSYYEIAKKAMLVNISDAVAMNATPRYALLAVAMPKSIKKADAQELVRGFQETANQFGIEIIGGDTISNTKLDITVTIVSKAKQKVLRREKIRQNYLLAYTGELGNSASELKKLFNLGKIHKYSKFTDIRLRQEFIMKSIRYLKAGMDISDGLASDVAKLASLNRVGFTYLQKLEKRVLCSGEEYEMLVAFDRRDKKSLLRRAKQSRVKLTIFAKASRTKYTNRCKAHHF